MPSDADYWYALGVKDGRDGCLVELDALQARCDELEAERDLLRQQRDGFLKIVTKALRDVVDEGE